MCYFLIQFNIFLCKRARRTSFLPTLHFGHVLIHLLCLNSPIVYLAFIRVFWISTLYCYLYTDCFKSSYWHPLLSLHPQIQLFSQRRQSGMIYPQCIHADCSWWPRSCTQKWLPRGCATRFCQGPKGGWPAFIFPDHPFWPHHSPNQEIAGSLQT